MTDMTDVLRLEIEKTPTGLQNLVENPSGELGGWGWITPLSDSSMSTTGLSLLYYRGTAGASYFYTEPLAVTAGQYVAASYWWEAFGTSARTRFEYLNSSFGVISSSTQSALIGAAQDQTRQNLGPFLAPASTAYVRLRFDLYTSGGANPTGANSVLFSEVTVAKAATSAALATFRRNLMPNPSMTTNAVGWSGLTNCNVARSTAQFLTTPASLSITSVADGHVLAQSDPIPITGTTRYQVSCSIRSASGTRSSELGFIYYDSMGVQIQTTYAGVSTHGTTFVRRALMHTAPSNAASLRVVVRILNTLAGEVHYVDSVMLEPDAAYGPIPAYFDGSTPDAGGWDYAWTGTANASASTATLSALQYIEPVQYVNILGPTHEIRVSREELNVGTLAATVLSSTLDPSQDDLIRPGKKVRVLYLDETEDVWKPIFTGEASTARVTYDLLHPNAEKRARIEIVAVDAISALAQAKRPDGVASIDDLPFVLEGAGVPWNVNGSGSQVSSATVVSFNDNATAVDQIAITRDSGLGYAWVDRYGVVQVWNQVDLEANASDNSWYLDEGWYNADIDIDYDTGRCINSVSVKLLRFEDGQTVEVVFGPYEDAASIAEWGRRSAEFTVHGIAETDIALYADNILAANGTPQIRVNSVVVPLTPPHLYVAGVELYEMCWVPNSVANLDLDMRVTGVEHTISADNSGGKWLMKLNFAHLGGVATPQVIPPVNAGEPIGGPVRIGDMVMSGRTDESFGFVKANGQLLNVADYPALFAVYGYTYGGAGAQFAVINMTDLFPIAAGTKALGTTGGSSTKTLTAANLPPHPHTINHGHSIATSTTAGSSTANVMRGNATAAGNAGPPVQDFNGNSGNGPGTSTPVDVMNPWRAVNMFIKARA